MILQSWVPAPWQVCPLSIENSFYNLDAGPFAHPHWLSNKEGSSLHLPGMLPVFSPVDSPLFPILFILKLIRPCHTGRQG